MAVTRTRKRWAQFRVDWTNGIKGIAPFNEGPFIKNVELFETRTGDKSPNFKALIQSQKNATTELDASYDSFTYTPGWASCHSVKGIQGPWIGSNMIIIPDARLASYPNWKPLADKALADGIKFFNQHLVSYQRPFASQVFLGELRETITYLRNPFATGMKLAQALDAKAKTVLGRVKNSKKATQAICDLWLEFRFGVVPLLSDVKEILLLINELSKKQNPERIKGYGEAIASSTVMSDHNPTSLYGFKCEKVTDYRVQCFIKAGLLAERIDNALSSTDRALNAIFAIEAIPETIWELTPYSFLVDYFVNIGDIIATPLEAYGYLSYYSRSLVYTTEVRARTVTDQVLAPRSVASHELIKPASWVHKRRRVVRTAVAQAIPPLYFELPGSGVRYANIAALFASKFLKGLY